MIEIQNITDVIHYIEGLRVILFDLDDTLYGEKEYVRSGYRAAAMTIPQVDNAEEKLWNAFTDKKSAFDEVLKAEGIYTEELKQECLHAYRRHKPDIHFYQGTEALLINLRDMGYKLGIITDGRPEGQWAKMDALGLAHYVDHIIVTDELGGIEFRKPCDLAYCKMREWFGCEFYDMCYVGDNRKKDFVAPEKLGIKPIWFKNPDGLYTNLKG